jgi:hypothetical protein
MGASGRISQLMEIYNEAGPQKLVANKAFLQTSEIKAQNA